MAASSGNYQSSGMLTRDQLIYLFDRFAYLASQPDVKKRIADAVNDKQEAVAVTTALQEEIFLEMGVDPRFGLACLGKVNMDFENDQDLMIRFYGFVAKEELACEEAELGPDKFAERMNALQKLHEKQLEMLQNLRNFDVDDQSAILEKRQMFIRIKGHPLDLRLQPPSHPYHSLHLKLHQQMERENFDSEASVLSEEQIQDIVRRRVSPLFQPRYHLA